MITRGATATASGVVQKVWYRYRLKLKRLDVTLSVFAASRGRSNDLRFTRNFVWRRQKFSSIRIQNFTAIKRRSGGSGGDDRWSEIFDTFEILKVTSPQFCGEAVFYKLNDANLQQLSYCIAYARQFELSSTFARALRTTRRRTRNHWIPASTLVVQ